MAINRSDYPLVPLSLVGLNGNVFFLMGAFASAARKAGWPQEAIDDVMQDCRSADYGHALNVLSDCCVNGGYGLEDEDE